MGLRIFRRSTRKKDVVRFVNRYISGVNLGRLVRT